MVLPDDMLVKVDRASMAVSLEVRVPLLDHRLVEWAWRLPAAVKMRDGQGKWLLRQVADRYVPHELVDRPKMGFDPPLAPGCGGRCGRGRRTCSTHAGWPTRAGLRPGRAAGWDEHLDGRRNHDYALWTVLMFQPWLDAHEDAA